MSTFRRFSAVAGILLSIPGISQACPSCYGAADSPMTAGMNTAILVMLGITGFVLSLIAGAFIVIWRKAKRSTEKSAEVFVDEQGVLKTKNDKGVVEWNKY